MNVRKIPAFASLLVPTQTARTFVAAPLVMYYDLTREHAQVTRKNPQLRDSNTSLAGPYHRNEIRVSITFFRRVA